jgi:hypothetical protein
MFRNSVLDHGLSQHVDDLVAVDPAVDMDRQALPPLLLDQVQETYRPSIVRECAHQVVGPDVIPPLRPQPYAGAVVEPQAATRLLLLRDLQPFAAPYLFHSVFAHVPSGFLQLDGDASISIPAILTGQFDDGPGQRVFLVSLCRLIALRAAWLVNQLARMTLTCPLLPTTSLINV